MFKDWRELRAKRKQNAPKQEGIVLSPRLGPPLLGQTKLSLNEDDGFPVVTIDVSDAVDEERKGGDLTAGGVRLEKDQSRSFL